MKKSINKRLSLQQKPLGEGSFFVKQVTTYQLLKQLVPVQSTNIGTCIVVVGDIGGILCEQVANDLIDGIIAFFIQSIEYIPQNLTHILLVLTGNHKFNCTVRHEIDLLNMNVDIITQKQQSVKGCYEFFYKVSI